MKRLGLSLVVVTVATALQPLSNAHALAPVSAKGTLILKKEIFDGSLVYQPVNPRDIPQLTVARILTLKNGYSGYVPTQTETFPKYHQAVETFSFFDERFDPRECEGLLEANYAQRNVLKSGPYEGWAMIGYDTKAKIADACRVAHEMVEVARRFPACIFTFGPLKYVDGAHRIEMLRDAALNFSVSKSAHEWNFKFEPNELNIRSANCRLVRNDRDMVVLLGDLSGMPWGKSYEVEAHEIRAASKVYRSTDTAPGSSQ